MEENKTEVSWVEEEVEAAGIYCSLGEFNIGR